MNSPRASKVAATWLQKNAANDEKVILAVIREKAPDEEYPEELAGSVVSNLFGVYLDHATALAKTAEASSKALPFKAEGKDHHSSWYLADERNGHYVTVSQDYADKVSWGVRLKADLNSVHKEAAREISRFSNTDKGTILNILESRELDGVRLRAWGEAVESVGGEDKDKILWRPDETKGMFSTLYFWWDRTFEGEVDWDDDAPYAEMPVEYFIATSWYYSRSAKPVKGGMILTYVATVKPRIVWQGTSEYRREYRR